jgi:hypothetical protein
MYAQWHSPDDYETMGRHWHHASFSPESTMTTISKDADLIALINVFTVAPRIRQGSSSISLRWTVRRYIQRYNEAPRPTRWTYSNPGHRITTDSVVTGH